MSYLSHYGMPRRSGRYPWGSGKDPYQSALSFRGAVAELRAQGLSEVEIARGMGILDAKGNPSTARLRALVSINKAEIRAAETAEAIRLKERGLSNVAIAERMGKNESSVRALLDPVLKERAAITSNISNTLKESVAKYKYIDVGTGVENHMGISGQRLRTAIAELQEQGYKLHYVKVQQLGMPGQYTSIKVLGGPDSSFREVFENKDLIQPVGGRSDDGGRTFSDLGLKPIKSVNSNDIAVRYGPDGGKDKDGVIELRRGVPELNLGNSQYAQVRIGVDGTHYLKGMAMYSDNMPDGVNIIFNTNKQPTDNKLDVMKKMGDDPDNPFGSTIKVDGQRGALNIIREEGDWDTWSRTLSSQVLSKQTPALAKQQLEVAYQLKKDEFSEEAALTNPVVKQILLEKFADGCDSAAVHLKAAALPRQSSKVILPITNMRPNEVYAPTYNNGETVVLIRHPHGGRFEIPQLVVNNNSKEARAVMANAKDAIGIHPSVASKLSGADFDGDTVIVIPNDKRLIRIEASLRGLKNFDTRESYPPFDGMKTIDGGVWDAKNKKVDYGDKRPTSTMQTKMGEVSNLITDMTIKGAKSDEIARAVRHSMVIIDSEKHHLNYKQSYIDNGIAALAEKYQGSPRGGAATLISRAKSEYRVPARKSRVTVDPKTGEKVYILTGETYVDDRGRVQERKTKSTKMAEAHDARVLSSGTPIEEAYATHANKLKALANTARKEALSVQTIPYSPSARTAYQTEVNSLKAKLNEAQKNRPLERQAQIIANTVVAKKIEANPEIKKDKDAIKKLNTQALASARVRTGASKKEREISITTKEWEAIQAGAVSKNTLIEILNNSNLDSVKKLATPRESVSLMTTARISRAKSMLNAGHTQAEVADALGVSVSTLAKVL